MPTAASEPFGSRSLEGHIRRKQLRWCDSTPVVAIPRGLTGVRWLHGWTCRRAKWIGLLGFCAERFRSATRPRIGFQLAANPPPTVTPTPTLTPKPGPRTTPTPTPSASQIATATATPRPSPTATNCNANTNVYGCADRHTHPHGNGDAQADGYTTATSDTGAASDSIGLPLTKPHASPAGVRKR